jgi:biopolymer transport protein ExbD
MRKRKYPSLQEDVVCNLIPMVDIMFLLLLFFMLSADMTQRELEDLVLPQGDQVKEDPKEADKDPRTTINLFHRADSAAFNCPINKRGGVCREDEHWLIAIRSEEFTLETVKAKLKEVADESLEPEPDPIAKKQLSRRKVIIRGDKAAPYGHVQKLIEICGTSGIYKIEVGAALPPKG